MTEREKQGIRDVERNNETREDQTEQTKSREDARNLDQVNRQVYACKNVTKQKILKSSFSLSLSQVWLV